MEIKVKKEVEIEKRIQTLPSNIDIYKCPRCNEEHTSFNEEIGGILHNICEKCLTDEEKQTIKKFSAKKLEEKYLKYLE